VVKVATLGAVAVLILACVMIGIDSAIEEVAGFFYLLANAWQINKFEWSAVFFN